MHLRAVDLFDWRPIYVFSGAFGFFAVLQIGLCLYRSKNWGRPSPRVEITRNHAVMQLTLHLSKPLRVKAGQYINIWIPSISLLSSHPFTVVSWHPSPQKSMEFFIQPMKGFTNRLHQYSSSESTFHIQTRAYFTSPHGVSISAWKFDFVLLVASGFGIVSMLPYLKELIDRSRICQSLTRRVHLLWHVENLGMSLCTSSAKLRVV
jgi:NAD(P)H-flavin reductase